MNDDETMEIEAMLARYRPAGPADALKHRVISAQPKRDSLYWEALAAGILLALCLIQVSGSTAAVQPVVRIEPADVPPDLASRFTEEELGAARIALAGSAAIRGLPQSQGGPSWDKY